MIEVKDLADIPEKYHADYVEVEKDGAKIYQHKDFVTVVGAMKRKGEERDALANELKGFKSQEAVKQAEAEKKALEKLKAEGKIDEILADSEKRHGETIRQFEERIAKRDAIVIKKARDAVVSELSTLATEVGAKAFKKLISERVDYDPETDKYSFKDEEGGATSLDLAGFKADVLKSPTYAAMLKAQASSGGFGTNASNGGGAAKTITRAQFDSMSQSARAAHFKSGGTITNQRFLLCLTL